jgi:hypothetical protein
MLCPGSSCGGTGQSSQEDKAARGMNQKEDGAIMPGFATDINAEAKKYVRGDRLVETRIYALLTDPRAYRGVRDLRNNEYDADGNKWMTHTLYSGYLAAKGSKAVRYFAEGTFTDAFMEAIRTYDKDKGEFVTYFCGKLRYMAIDHFKKLAERNGEVSNDGSIGDDDDTQYIDTVEDPDGHVEIDYLAAEHKHIVFGRYLINIFEFNKHTQAKAKRNGLTPTERVYIKTFYTLDACALVRIANEPYIFIRDAHKVKEAVDCEIMCGLYTTICKTFKKVLSATDKYPEDVVSDAKGAKNPGRYRDSVIPKIKRTGKGDPIKKEQVSVYRKIYNEVAATFDLIRPSTDI